MESKEYFEKIMQDIISTAMVAVCASIVRTAMEHNPKNYDEAFIFYSKDYRKVKILHYDINGWVMYSKWFTDGKFLQPKFEECKKCHEISRQILTLLLSTSVQTKLAI